MGLLPYWTVNHPAPVSTELSFPRKAFFYRSMVDCSSFFSAKRAHVCVCGGGRGVGMRWERFAEGCVFVLCPVYVGCIDAYVACDIVLIYERWCCRRACAFASKNGCLSCAWYSMIWQRMPIVFFFPPGLTFVRFASHVRPLLVARW